ncbi:DUF4389 domain-containing protein [Microbulbifer thermotolerans]|uniref:DUF4389 domain-containing protein n=1 Tax=Microbulbifer thermotolerans TaxID=252514 RepID=A0AB35HZ88_MICTH|nr:DUF4389 domain-containing protein [Microbulbifer thermotolerans]MCX2778912.1 DUF4389 domain-containing protein [Microbulbifer thermotolerans]MCX2781456.1 DUF4389 domain-containing protein [Microbulbifer thermotolerans]MCX2793798.1 DUF4389 domain-containing protein [Microbulbifer thermotolerans]MCX2802358.1 DUF4389 domain-containing protein [Microbulbifer thermotolerans]MCX2804217.1 DUF4389 domain-containing protein [Microbulbifer thermotolerans]
MDNDDLKKNLTSGNQWMRLLYMVLFFFLLEIAGVVMLAVVVLQFLFAIITGGANDNLRRLGDQIASYVYQTLQFLVYNTEEKPFPFSEWPQSEAEDLSGFESAQEVNTEVVSGTEAEASGEVIELGSDTEAEEKSKADGEPSDETGAEDAGKPEERGGDKP